MTSSTEDSRAARLRAARHLEGDARLGERPLGPHDALGHGRLGDEEGPRDLVGGQAAEQAQGEGHARLGGQDGMAGREDEAQQVVADVVVERRLQLRRRQPLPGLQLAAELLVLALGQLPPAQPVDGPVLGRGHEPGAGVVRDARLAATARGR